MLVLGAAFKVGACRKDMPLAHLGKNFFEERDCSAFSNFSNEVGHFEVPPNGRRILNWFDINWPTYFVLNYFAIARFRVHPEKLEPQATLGQMERRWEDLECQIKSLISLV